jgi:hypothetical protein
VAVNPWSSADGHGGAQVESAGERVETALRAAYESARAVQQEAGGPQALSPKAPTVFFDDRNNAVWIKLAKGSEVRRAWQEVL